MKQRSIKSRIIGHIRSRIIIGMSVFLPVMILFVALQWAIGKIDNLIRPLFEVIPLVPDVILIIPGLGIILTVIFFYFVGLVSVYPLGKLVIKQLHRIKGYEEIKKLIGVLLGLDKGTVESNRIVLVEYPSREIWVLGLFMSESIIDGEQCVLVFIATPPLPNNGTLAFIPKTKIRYAIVLNNEGDEQDYMSRVEYMKYIISAGTVSPSNMRTVPLLEE